jgi:hypothetical protein
MKERPPPTKELCLHLAEIYYEMGMPQRSWQYLLCWAAYEDYLDIFWGINNV